MRQSLCIQPKPNGVKGTVLNLPFRFMIVYEHQVYPPDDPWASPGNLGNDLHDSYFFNNEGASWHRGPAARDMRLVFNSKAVTFPVLIG